MSEWICNNCGQPLRVLWDASEGYYPSHYGASSCAAAEFTEEDAAILDNDYAE